MVKIHWHLRVTIESSAKQRAEEIAEADRRSSANYVGLLIEKANREKDAMP